MDPKLPLELNVLFRNVPYRYEHLEVILCTFELNDYTVEEGDRIAIFKNGWTSLDDYVLFELVKKNATADDLVGGVVFQGENLKSLQPDEWYQFCFINRSNIIQGVSTPFQIVARSTNNSDKGEEANNIQTTDLLQIKDAKIASLKEENYILKRSLKALTNETTELTNATYEQDLNSLKDITKALQDTIIRQQEQIEDLKTSMQTERHRIDHIEKNSVQGRRQNVKSENREGKAECKLQKSAIDDLPSLPPFPFDWEEVMSSFKPK